MSSSTRIERFEFERRSIASMPARDATLTNWPVAYTINDETRIYVGESLNAASRMRQHADSPTKAGLETIRVFIDSTFNKSSCLDLESYLIRMFAGDGRFAVLNRNEGITNAEYYDRVEYQKKFDDIFEALRREGLFSRSIEQIENSDLFKLSPFKALSHEQAAAVEDILEGLFADLAVDRPSSAVVEGAPGTGKTIVAIYLLKLLMDIKNSDPDEVRDSDSVFSEFFVSDNREALVDFRVGLVVPQQSLRTSIQRVFRKTPGLSPDMVLTPFQVCESDERYDLIVVDETHRLNHRANQPSGVQNKRFTDINEKLFGADADHYTQIDWIRELSDHQLFLVDAAQRVRPADLPTATLRQLVNSSTTGRSYRLQSQFRVRGGDDYISFVKELLGGAAPEPRSFGDYDFRMFDDLGRCTPRYGGSTRSTVSHVSSPAMHGSGGARGTRPRSTSSSTTCD